MQKIRDFALNAQFKTKKITVPEWGGQEITVRELDAKTRGLVLHLGASKEASERAALCRWILADVAIASVRDAEGKPAFEAADRQSLAEIPGGALQLIFDTALTISNLTAEDLAAAEKN